MTDATPSIPRANRLAAVLIGCTAIFELVLVTHHPVVSQTEQDPGVPLERLAAIIQTNLTFHAVLMLIAVGQLVGLFLFARRLGLDRPLVLAGTIFCSLATVLLVIAMTFDGFVVYELMDRCGASATGCTQETARALGFASAIIQGFTKLGFGAQCLGFIALGVASWSLGGKVRIGAAASVVAALAPIVIVTSGAYVGPQQLTQILALLAGWGLCVATILLADGRKRSRKSADATSSSATGR